MKRLGFNINFLVTALIIAASAGNSAGAARAAKDEVDFQRDIRPILSDICFNCHGPDVKARKAKLRLDTLEGALKDLGGYAAVVPGRPEKSELVKRLTSLDPDEKMPPPDFPRQLSPRQIELFRKWIAQGAKWSEHWAFSPVVKPPIPPIRRPVAEIRNSIDNFVLAGLDAAKLKPSAPADKATLIRRVSFDLTGLPPTPAEVDAFLADKSSNAWDKVVARLLDSPRFGERMAMDWLDAARYADSNGYFRDNARQAWPWRDWVINAFNHNMSFDRFTIEQLAGDLLPGATMEQKIATGFNRNHMVTGETGIIDEEYRVEYVADRLETTSTVWLGLTVGCARCHDHKYDPITQREYYQLFAFFNNGPEKGLVSADDPPPTLDVATPGQRAELEQRRVTRSAMEERFELLTRPIRASMAAWEKTAVSELQPPRTGLAAHVDFEPGLTNITDAPCRATEKGGNFTYEPGLVGHAAVFDAMQHVELPADLALDADQPWSIGIWLKPTGSLNCVLSKIEPTGTRRGFELLWQKGQLQINLVNHWVASAIEVTTKEAMRRSDWHQVIVSYDGSGKAAGLRVFVDGAEAPLNIVRDTLAGPSGNMEPLRIGRRDNGLGFYGHLDELRVFRRAIGSAEAETWYWSDRLRGLLAVAADKRDAKQKALLLDYYVGHHADTATRDAHRSLATAREAEDSFRAQLPKTLVMQELQQPRATHLLMRGAYDQPGEAVPAGVPASLPPLPADAPRDRLGLARWIASPANPLTARVEVNRLWQYCFGEGLVRTMNDFGSQGELPAHPALLDWLAAQFMEGGWNVKEMLRLIVTSATYRQSSVAGAALLRRDPDNRLLARGPRFRLSAEMIRDQALAASGLIVERIGGPGVKPWQPPGLWEAVSYDGELTYQPDRGDGLWRRSLYTFWKRQAPPPSMLTFDGPTRETCVVRRPRTNTPMQALALLNDDTWVEAARALAALVITQGGKNPDDRLRDAFRRVTSRAPDSGELTVLRRLLEQQRSRFTADPGAARKLTRVGTATRGHELDASELAAWTAVAQALLNLDEVITRR
jgi:hypothetical protein